MPSHPSLQSFMDDLNAIRRDRGMPELDELNEPIDADGAQEFISRQINLALADKGACRFRGVHFIVPNQYVDLVDHSIGNPLGEPDTTTIPGSALIRVKDSILQLMGSITAGDLATPADAEVEPAPA